MKRGRRELGQRKNDSQTQATINRGRKKSYMWTDDMFITQQVVGRWASTPGEHVNKNYNNER